MSEDSAIATLLALYESADADIVRRGRDWYTAARSECAAIAADSGYTVAQVAAVMAITSPDAQLTTNITWTRNACMTRGAAKVGKYPNAMRPKVLGALADADNPGQFATGPKVSQFFAAIIGDESAMVVDRWAAFAAGHENRQKVPGAKVRRSIEAAYRAAAAIVGETVAAFQAIVWIVVRETTIRADGRINKLADITA
jgi:hypothetical protein